MAQIIRPGIIKAIRNYGVKVEVAGEVVLVHMYEQSWLWPYDGRRHWKVGDPCLVWSGEIDRYGEGITLIHSFRRVRNDCDPSGSFKAGDTISGTVVSAGIEGVSVIFGPAQEADFAVESVRSAGYEMDSIIRGGNMGATVASLEEGPKIILVPHRISACVWPVDGQ